MARVPVDLPALLTAQEVADHFRTSTSAIYRWAREGILPSIRIGGRVLFRQADIERFQEAESA